MNITVYLGANTGNDPRLSEAVKRIRDLDWSKWTYTYLWWL